MAPSRTPLVATVAVAAALLLTACSDGSPEVLQPETDAHTTEGEQADTGDTGTDPAGAAYQVGDQVQIGDWSVVVTDVTQDATEVLLAESELNDPPVDGRQFVLVTVDTTYTGTATGTAWVDLTLGLDGADGVTYSGGVDDFCGILPNSLSDQGEQGPGETATGTVCAALPADQVVGSTLGLELFLGADGERQLIELVPAG